MSKIRLLDEATINKIAAGEVIEKPSSIVKELVENSVDAGATAITVELTDGGKSFISISDNGSGIAQEDVEHVFERHATSKIRSSDDLFEVLTLGFRGEAMASIAAVAEVELKTKTEEASSGQYVLIRGGSIIERKEIGLPVGTTVIVRNLFFNTPARYKFLKSDISEQGHIVDIVEKLALSNTIISFKLIVNGKTVLHTPGNGDLLSVIHCIYGKNTAKSMLYLDYKNDIIHIEGYIGKPEAAKGNSTYMIFSVNKRVIKSRMMIEALRQAYKTLLMNNRFPFAILNINMNTDRLDVNVHPTKAEIRFSDDRAVFNTLYIAVKNCLSTSEMFFGATEPEERSLEARPEPIIRYEQEKLEEKVLDSGIERQVNFSRPAFEYKAQTMAIPKREEIPNLEPSTNHFMSSKKEHEAVFEQPIDRVTPVYLQVIGQLMGTYILAQSRDTFYMIDQHAAHERITYEFLMEKYDTGDIAVQELLLPIIIELSPKEKVLLDGSISFFHKLGFELEWFGENAAAVRAIPIIMGEPCSGEFFSELLGTLEGDGKQLTNPKEKLIISMSCKNSIKAGAILSIDEMNELISRLFKTKLPYTCPHGRPTIITMSAYEIEKKFKRVL